MRTLVIAVATSALVLTSCSSMEDIPLPPPSATPYPQQEQDSVSTDPVDLRPAFLAELRARSIPISETGEGEIQVARGVCSQIANGAKPDALAQDLTALGWSKAAALVVVEAAQRYFCP